MTERPTPFALVFGEIAPARFPEIAAALEAAGRGDEDRDAFVLLEPVARLVRELVPDDVSPDELEAHLRLLHHAYRHWSAGGRVYRIGQAALDRATRAEGGPLSSRPARNAFYLQVPAGRVWRHASDAPPEPLDGMFVTTTPDPGAVQVLAVFGMQRNRPGFSAVALEGHADESDAGAGEIEIAARRDDGSPPFAPLLAGAGGGGVYSVANAGELLLLACRLIALLPARERGMGKLERLEHFLDV